MIARLAPAFAAFCLAGGPAMADDHVELTAGFLRAGSPGTPVVGGYAIIANTGEEDDVLISAATDAAGRVELHEMAMDGDVMRMRALPDGIAVPAGETVVLRPGGVHLMLMDLAGPVTLGETRDVTLAFSSGAEVTAPFTVAALPEIELGMQAAGAPAEAPMAGGDAGMDGDG